MKFLITTYAEKFESYRVSTFPDRTRAQLDITLVDYYTDDKLEINRKLIKNPEIDAGNPTAQQLFAYLLSVGAFGKLEDGHDTIDCKMRDISNSLTIYVFRSDWLSTFRAYTPNVLACINMVISLSRHNSKYDPFLSNILNGGRR